MSALSKYVGEAASIERYDNVWQVVLGPALLAIYNPVTLGGRQLEVDHSLHGLTLQAVEETPDRLILEFGHDMRLEVDLRDSAFKGPEAMELTESGQITVWQ